MPEQCRNEFACSPVPHAHAVVPRRTRRPPSVWAECDVRDLPLVACQARERLQLPSTLSRGARRIGRRGARREERPQEERVVVRAGDKQLAGGRDECVVAFQRELLG